MQSNSTIGIMETTIVYWGYIGIMEKKMETTIVYYSFLVAFVSELLTGTPRRTAGAAAGRMPAELRANLQDQAACRDRS